MFRDLKLKPVTMSQNPNVIVLPGKLKAQDDRNTYLALLAPGDPRAAAKEAAYYPVEFDDTVPDGRMDVCQPLLNHLYYDKTSDYRVELASKNDLISKNKINKEPAGEIWLEIKRVMPALHELHKIDRQKLMETCKLVFARHPFCVGQSLIIGFDGLRLELNVTSIGPVSSDAPVFYLNEASKLNLKLANPAPKNLAMRDLPLNKTLPLDFLFKGVGGHKKALEDLVRDAFFSRAKPDTAKRLGLRHAKGVLLYGPPGTGKTLIARTIADIFPKNNVKVVNGPEVLNKMVGQSEENIRTLFSDAEIEKNGAGDDSELHIIIFDEFDAIASARGIYSDNTGVKAGMVTQLSSFLDGYLERPNVLIICTTNRLDLIDPALLRPGRIDTLIEIGLPNEEERLEILKIMTSAMTENNLLAKDVDLAYWANKTKDYSGAELQALVNKAGKHYLRYFFEESQDRKELRMRKDMAEIERSMKVTQDFFELAFKEITPAYGIDKSRFNFDQKKFADYNQHIYDMLNDFRSAVADLQQSSNMKKLNVLIRGDTGTGKTELAKNMAFQSGATNIRVITANDLLALPLSGKLKFIIDEFRHAQQTKFSAVILDGLEDIIKSDIYQDQMRINIEKLLDENGESPNKCVIIATTSNAEELETRNLAPMFSETYQLENIRINNLDEAKSILRPVCEAMGYTLVIPRNPPMDCSIDMPIRELRIKIDRFCLHNKGELKLDLFFEELKGLNEKRKMASQMRLVGTAGGSPLHQPVEQTESRADVHFITKQK